MPTIFIDMDGVLVDFVLGAMQALGNPIPNNWETADEDYMLRMPYPRGVVMLNETLGLTYEDFWEKLLLAKPAFWESLEPYPWADRLYLELSQLAPVMIVSKPTEKPSCVEGKVAWLHRWFGFPFDRYIMTHQKAEALAKPGAIILDDLQANVNDFVERGGKGVLFPQPWNGDQAAIYDEAKVAKVIAEVKALL
jgi:5'(3')-deoxyribonucleotidase